MTEDELAHHVTAVESEIATCMAEAGFEYTPVDVDTIRDAADNEKLGLPDAEFAAQYGYGVATRLGEPDPVVESGRGADNIAYLEALLPDQRAAYVMALYGSDNRASFARTLEDEDFTTTGGCTRVAVEQFFTADELDSGYETPFDLFIAADARMIAAVDAWSNCMADRGFDYTDPDQPKKDVKAQLAAITTPDTDPADLTQDELAAVTALQEIEVAVALAAHDCELEHIDDVAEVIEIEVFGEPSD